MRSTKPLVVVLAVLAVASCGGSSRKAAPVAPPISLAIATAAVPATAPPATVPPPTAPPTTVAPTTTTMSLQDLEKVVRARFLENFGPDIERCLASPAACDVAAITPEAGARRSQIGANIKNFVDHKWISREPADDPSYSVIQSVAFDEKRTKAVVLSCAWDTGVIMQPATAPDGGDILVNDLKNSYDHRSEMILDRGKWFVSVVQVVAKHEGVNQCATRP